MELSRAVKTLLLFAAITVALYTPHLSDGFVYQDSNLGFTASPYTVHLVSLGLHLVNGLLLYAIAKRADWPGAAWIACLFWLHPLATEAVAYGAAQSELLMLASGLLFVWSLQRRLWIVLVLPILVLSTTKARGLPGALTNDALAQGVSYLRWWQWEATAAWRLMGLWIVPLHLSFDHDTVHVALWLQRLALASLPVVLGGVLWMWRAARWPVLWLSLVLVPRFAVRNPLGILNEHHWYPITPALAVLTVLLWSQLWLRSQPTAERA